MAARFIGVQLEIESPRPLGHLFHDFSGAEVVSVDYRESMRGFAVAFEHARSGMSTDPDVQIEDFCDTILGSGTKRGPCGTAPTGERSTSGTRSTTHRRPFAPNWRQRRWNESPGWVRP